MAAGADRAAARSTFWWSPKLRSLFSSCSPRVCLSGHSTSSTPVAVISERLARTYFGNENPVGRRITFLDEKRDLEIVGVSANLRYGGLKGEEKSPMTVFTAASQFSPDRVTYALRTAGDPLRYCQECA